MRYYFKLCPLDQLTDFHERVLFAYYQFKRIKQVKAKTIGVSPEHANYKFELLQTKVDMTLEGDLFWLSDR